MLLLGILSLTVVKCRKEEGKDKDEIVLLKQNEISSLIMEAATLKKYIWSCFGQTAPAGCEEFDPIVGALLKSANSFV